MDGTAKIPQRRYAAPKVGPKFENLFFWGKHGATELTRNSPVRCCYRLPLGFLAHSNGQQDNDVCIRQTISCVIG